MIFKMRLLKIKILYQNVFFNLKIEILCALNHIPFEWQLSLYFGLCQVSKFSSDSRHSSKREAECPWAEGDALNEPLDLLYHEEP